ncbi:hypothetical protein VPNG_07883 [Cytospora leucostoma]|uniref:Uncharacterized protein n=1 Tax=Cytospora leucostoma TaxID=1230097 RepID=A0A423WGT8_9PEZI|nr:hypothetical protein VPNG_07883 [Cytospora leucostoma]
MFPQFILCLFLGILTPLATANVEKTIFLGPEPVNIPHQHPTLSDLNIDSLTPETWSLRTHLEAIFPTEDLTKGKSTWLILDNLSEGQRYEVRICWLATQPTDFHLQTYTLPTVFDTPELITSLHNYSISRQPAAADAPIITTHHPPTTTGERQSSVLFLRIDAAASYISSDRALMEHPEPVVADIILDPFVYNVLPRTLVPTVGYVVFIAALSWILSTRVVVPWVSGLMVGGGVGESVAVEEERKRK